MPETPPKIRIKQNNNIDGYIKSILRDFVEISHTDRPFLYSIQKKNTYKNILEYHSLLTGQPEHEIFYS